MGRIIHGSGPVHSSVGKMQIECISGSGEIQVGRHFGFTDFGSTQWVRSASLVNYFFCQNQKFSIFIT